MTRLADHFRTWADLYKHGHVRPVTYRKYTATADKLDKYCPDVQVETISRADYQSFINLLAVDYEKQTVMDVHHQVAACLKDAVYDGLLDKDPTYGARITGKSHVVKHAAVLSKTEAESLVTALDLSVLGIDAGIYLSITTGLRLAEMLGLTPDDITGQHIIVNKTYNYKSQRGVTQATNFQPTKNTSSMRKILVTSEIIEKLRDWSEAVPANESIFIRVGRYADEWNSRLTEHCTALEIPGITMHGLRHTHASLLLTEGVSIQAIAKRLGHANTITTQRTYLHLIKELEDAGNAQVLSILEGMGKL